MDDVAYLRDRIESYADYTDQDARHLVDKQVRAWVGEAISRLRERMMPTGETADALDALIVRCEFSDQKMVHAADRGSFDDAALVARIHALDRALVDIADHAPTVEAERLPAYVARVNELFDERFGAISDAAPIEHAGKGEWPVRA